MVVFLDSVCAALRPQSHAIDERMKARLAPTPPDRFELSPSNRGQNVARVPGLDMKARLVVAIEMAVARRGDVAGCILHSDAQAAQCAE